MSSTIIEPPLISQPPPAPILQNTQAYILEGHGCDYVWHFLLRFTSHNIELLRRRISELAAEVTPAVSLHSGDKPGIVSAFGLSGPGLEWLKLPDKYCPDFKQGLRSRLGAIEREFTADWEKDWIGERYHAILIVAARHEQDLPQRNQYIQEHFKDLATVMLEQGFVKREKVTSQNQQVRHKGHPVEASGFVDGISQPVFPGTRAAARQTPGDPPKKFDSSANFSLALIHEPHPGRKREDEFGSYLAYLKIAQPVMEFEIAAVRVASAYFGKPVLSLLPGEIEQAQTMLMGRKKSGCPLTPHCRKDANDFDRSEDKDGKLWPFGSHTSKMNSRDGRGRASRMIRRGVLYGEGEIGQEKNALGILFQSFQASVKHQFEAHLWWALSPGHPFPHSGADPLIGYRRNLQFLDKDGNPVTIPAPRVTTMLGGEYFYFPSIPSIAAMPSHPLVS